MLLEFAAEVAEVPANQQTQIIDIYASIVVDVRGSSHGWSLSATKQIAREVIQVIGVRTVAVAVDIAGHIRVIVRSPLLGTHDDIAAQFWFCKIDTALGADYTTPCSRIVCLQFTLPEWNQQ
jgi:hypothetical protein